MSKLSYAIALMTVSVLLSSALAASTATYAYIANNDTNSLVEVNLATNNVVGSILLPFNGPYAVDAAPSGNVLYVSHTPQHSSLPGNVAIVNLTGSVLGYLATNPSYTHGPAGFPVTSNGLIGYEIDTYFQGINKINIQTGAYLDAFYVTSRFGMPSNELSLHSASLSANGNYLYIANLQAGSNCPVPYGSICPGVLIMSTATDTLVGNIVSNTINDAWDIAVAPNGQYAYLVNFGGSQSSGYLHGNILILDLVSNTVSGSIMTAGAFGYPQTVAFSPDGNTAYVTNGGFGNVVMISTATNSVVGTVSGVSFGSGDFENGLGMAFAPGPTLGMPSLSASNSVLDAGQTETLTLSWLGGTPSYNALFYNVSGSRAQGSANGISSDSASVSFTAGNVASQTTYTYNGAVTDSEPTPATENSVGVTVTVDPALEADAPTSPSTSLTTGQSATLTANPSGGTGSYSIAWYGQAGCGGASIGSGATYLASPSSSLTYSYKVADTGTTSPISECSSGITITVSQPASAWRPVPIITVLPRAVGTPGPSGYRARSGCDLLNMSRDSSAICTSGNLSFSVTEGTVSRDYSTTFIDGKEYTMQPGNSVMVSNTEGGAYYLELTGINYTNVYAGAPTAALALYFVPAAPASTSTTAQSTSTTSASTSIQANAPAATSTTTVQQQSQQGPSAAAWAAAAVVAAAAAAAAYALLRLRSRKRGNAGR